MRGPRRSGGRALAAALLIAGLAGAACRSAGAPAPAAPAPAESTSWAERTLAGLTLEEKAAQLLFVVTTYGVTHPDESAHRRLFEQVRELGVGGLVVGGTERDTLAILLNELQGMAEIPLLVTADTERSLNFRVWDGTVSLPYAMALGAIDAGSAEAGEAAARFAGELTAREARAIGIHWALAPVVDVNNNPDNPVINIRSFGEDPERVGRLGAAFVAGARAHGLLTTAKHFPGHGDTATDSHLALPTIAGDRERLDAIELAPFRDLVAAGVDGVMTGHLEVPALDPSGTPATLSAPITNGLLRGELGFAGAILTDAMDMSGVGDVWMGEAVVAAVAAGADVVLMPPDPAVARRALVDAVRDGRLDEARLDRSVLRLLELKERLGLHREGARFVDPLAARRAVGRPEDQARADAIARQSITVVRNEGGVLPLDPEAPLRILHLVLSSDWNAPGATGSIQQRELAARGVVAERRYLGPELPASRIESILAESRGATHVVASTFVRVTSSKGDVALDPTHAELLARLAEGDVPLVVVSYSSPYLLSAVPTAPVYVNAYGLAESSQRAAIGALFGDFPTTGRLPVTIPGLADRGAGVTVPERATGLAPFDPGADPATLGFRADGLAALDARLESAIAEGAFPGAVVAVGYKGRLAHLKAFGRQTYDEGAPAVTTDTIWDLASLTKVIVTTTLAMRMVDEGRLDLDGRVASYLPAFTGNDPDGWKPRVTIRHLLTHSSGIDWWAPLYEGTEGWDDYVAEIVAMPLVSEPGTEEKYSDLGIILLGEILQRVSGRDFEELAKEEIFEPLGMTDTGYRPHASLLPRIAATEVDSTWRNRLVHGTVHDENAAALGGVAPHAGLFSTAPDVARFVQMLVRGGFFEHRRMIRRETVERFTTKVDLVPGSDRCLGWDGKSVVGSSAGTRFSASSYGHTGFTGTSIWIDPERDLFVILLTNRVHPTRENRQLYPIRGQVADLVVEALLDPSPLHPPRGGARVVTGLERIANGESFGLEGKRLGLLVHRASVTSSGRHAVDAFRDRGLDVVRLFSPEHGLRGEAAAGEKVSDSMDPASGLPVVSLYGKKTQPTPEDLEGLDALVVDLQDVGVRFYTYVSTMILALEAAADAGVELVVLDRPNPLGGEYTAGPFSAPRDVVPRSLVNMAPGPLIHGLTIAEMAKVVNAERETPVKLTVVPMEGWKRKMRWPDTNLPWATPSPNLRSWQAAMAYPGVALLEATNVSEGRGTAQPFLRFGAPWLDPTEIAANPTVAGFELRPTKIEPSASSAAQHPKYLGQDIPAIQISLSRAARPEPLRLGLQILEYVRGNPAFEWLNNGDNFWRLVGGTDSEVQGVAPLRQDIALPEPSGDSNHWTGRQQSALIYSSSTW